MHSNVALMVGRSPSLFGGGTTLRRGGGGGKGAELLMYEFDGEIYRFTSSFVTDLFKIIVKLEQNNKTVIQNVNK